MATYTLAQLTNSIKRRIRQIRATTGSDTEEESGNLFGDTAIQDAINAGRKKIMIMVRNAEMWGKAEAIFATSEDIQEYALGEGVLKIDSVQYDVDSDGLNTETTYDATDVKDRKGEEACIADPYNTPSITNPKYRVTNRGIRLIVDTDGTVPKDTYIRVEYLKELSDLDSAEETSGLTATLDELVMNYAVFLLCEYPLPQVAAIALEDFNNQIVQMNMAERQF